MYIEFKANFNTTFSGQLEKKINNIAQKEKIKTAKALKADVENQWKETSVQSQKEKLFVIDHHGISTF